MHAVNRVEYACSQQSDWRAGAITDPGRNVLHRQSAEVIAVTQHEAAQQHCTDSDVKFATKQLPELGGVLRLIAGHFYHAECESPHHAHQELSTGVEWSESWHRSICSHD